MIKFIIMWNLVYFSYGATPIAQSNTEQACETTLKALQKARPTGVLFCIPTTGTVVVPK